MIKQYFLPAFHHFHEQGNEFEKILTPYTDTHAPAFFYSTLSLGHLMSTHKGPAVMIVNNDMRQIQLNLNWVKSKKDLYFISTSKLMSVYLDALGIDYVEFPWHVGNISSPTAYPKGNGVFFYGEGPHNNLYGYHILTKIIKTHFPHLNVIHTCYTHCLPAVAPFQYYTKTELEELYKRVFIGVRLTRFDGLSDTVQSLGLRGIKTIWNGGTVSALSYSSDQDIIEHIRKEEETIGQIDLELSNACKQYLNPLNEDYKYIFDLNTYTQKKETPKLFNNNQRLSFKDYNEIVRDAYDMTPNVLV